VLELLQQHEHSKRFQNLDTFIGRIKMQPASEKLTIGDGFAFWVSARTNGMIIDWPARGTATLRLADYFPGGYTSQALKCWIYDPTFESAFAK
jgi:hypothetical protein